MKKVCLALVLVAQVAAARGKPKLWPEAAEALQKSGLFLVAGDNVALPLVAGAKPIPFLATAAKRIDVISASPTGDALLAIDGDVYRLHGVELTAVASNAGTPVAASADGGVLVGIDDKKGIKVTVGDKVRAIHYHRSGRWELEQPYVAPDGSWALVALRDYTNPLDEYSLLSFEVKTGEPEEIALSKNFVPGSAREPLSGKQVALQMFSQSADADGMRTVLQDHGFLVFDLATKKLSPPPAALRPGLASAHKKYSLLAGPMLYDDARQCGGDETQLYTEGEKEPRTIKLSEEQVVSLHDFTPDEKSAVGSVLDRKSCKGRGFLIPLTGSTPPQKWPSFSIPSHEGRIGGRVLYPPKAAP
jgi:hypothetical protein